MNNVLKQILNKTKEKRDAPQPTIQNNQKPGTTYFPRNKTGIITVSSITVGMRVKIVTRLMPCLKPLYGALGTVEEFMSENKQVKVKVKYDKVCSQCSIGPCRAGKFSQDELTYQTVNLPAQQ